MTAISPTWFSPSTALEYIRPYRHEATHLDYNFGLFLLQLTAIILITPSTTGWKLFRAGIMAPLIVIGWQYCAWIPYVENSEEQWGTSMLMMFFSLRTLELLVFWPPEENVYRFKSVEIKSDSSNGHSISNGLQPPSDIHKNHTTTPSHETQLLPEPIPPPFTLAKLYWSTSLIWSWRGIGWNYSCPLPYSSRRQPYLRNSSRIQYIKYRIKYFIQVWIVWDIVRSYMNCSNASVYFGGGPLAPSYSSLTTFQRGVYSTCIVARVIISIEKTHIFFSLVFVSIGGLLDWEGEIWSPWGWPPIFGTLEEIWKYPGLSVMWSRTWQQYYRRVLYLFGWIGLGENILGFTHSGISAHPRALETTSTPSKANTPMTSGRTSPSNPVPIENEDKSRPKQQFTVKLAFSNFVKSLLVYTLSGLIHDAGPIALRLLYTPAEKPLDLSHFLKLTPFFALQPIGLVCEAVVKSIYRRWKKRRIGKDAKTPDQLILFERSIGFAWTWIWLGYTARFFVDGMTKQGTFSRADRHPKFPSLVGGLIWGKWRH